MLMSKETREQTKRLTPELDAEIKATMKFFDVLKREQSQEFIDAAKKVNAKLRAAGLTSLVLVES